MGAHKSPQVQPVAILAQVYHSLGHRDHTYYAGHGGHESYGWGHADYAGHAHHADFAGHADYGLGYGYYGQEHS